MLAKSYFILKRKFHDRALSLSLSLAIRKRFTIYFLGFTSERNVILSLLITGVDFRDFKGH